MSERIEGQFRQGDVLVQRALQMPQDAREEKREGDIVLAWGEVTFHAHRIKSRQVKAFQRQGGERWLRVVGKTRAFVSHEEHRRLELVPGDYRVIRQREFNEDWSRQVAD